MPERGEKEQALDFNALDTLYEAALEAKTIFSLHCLDEDRWFIRIHAQEWDGEYKSLVDAVNDALNWLKAVKRKTDG